MEGIIIMVIVFIVSSLLGKGKEQQQKKESKQMPPFSSQPAPRKQVKHRTEQNRPKTLEDFANEVFGQLNEKAKPVSQRIERELPKQAEKPVEAARSVVEPVTKQVNNARSLKERPIVAMAKKEAEVFQVVPSNKRDLMQAIIMTEVLGPPKARKK